MMKYSKAEVSRRFSDLMNAYHECLLVSDGLPSSQALDKMLIQHIVSTSSRQAAVFVKTRLTDAEKLYEVVCSFQKELQTEDLLGSIMKFVGGEIKAKLGALAAALMLFSILVAIAKMLVGVIGGIANSMVYGVAIWYLMQQVLPAMASVYDSHPVVTTIREKLEKPERELWALTGGRPPARPVLAMAALLSAGIVGAIWFLPVILASMIF